ncbi:MULTISPECIES: DUF1836 domain-containing protein [Enterococcus]|uniref:DUF1836 domain-containing protein n=1 Tax=Candidatus Enterococcus ferrettii TaxID=2815324 RepID=A0ABV0ETM1_9ENTE|nr:DUF1836 domain-containing protein [Enterococcus sp. 665A]MBO1342006.1 DUF1836 domain-containing protein [Enterococcus sp. 665A]
MEANEELKQWSAALKEVRLPRWEELPELELYMDQVITLIDRYLSPIIEPEKHHLLSSAMVNNYVKHKLVPPPLKKRYNKNHLAYLIAITLIKQVLTITDIKELIVMQLAIDEPKQAYNNFCQIQEESLRYVAGLVLAEENDPTLVRQSDYRYLAVENAAASFASKLLVEKIIELEKTDD